jgi:L-alanine-DL-glutamate epimerase-like enolase superfamily enzyme
MSSSAYRDTIHVRMTSDGVTGVGEGAPIVRYHEDAVSGKEAIDALQPFLSGANPWQFQKVMADVSRKTEGQFASQSRSRHRAAGLGRKETECSFVPHAGA